MNLNNLIITVLLRWPKMTEVYIVQIDCSLFNGDRFAKYFTIKVL